jgi:LmeA-like phospholipid-binding
MKKAAIVVGILVALLAVIGVGVDRAAAAVVERTVSERIGAELGGSGSVSTQVHGVPLVTQALRGSLDHVSVQMTDVPATADLTLDNVDVELYGVSTSEPRTADSVDALATLSTEQLQGVLGDTWTVRTDGTDLVVSVANGLPAEARVTPGVRDGAVVLDLASVSVLGLEVSGDSVPAAIRDRVSALAGSVGDLPFGLVPESVVVTPTGLELRATGTDVDLEAAR